MNKEKNELVDKHSENTEFDTEKKKLIYEVTHQKLEDQFDLIGKLDTKAGGVIALDAGILAFASTWSVTEHSKWIVVAGLIFLLASLSASSMTIFPRRLGVLPQMVKIWERYRSDTQSNLLDNLVTTLAQNVEHNSAILLKKRTWTTIAIALSILGFLLIGIAQIVRIIFL